LKDKYVPSFSVIPHNLINLYWRAGILISRLNTARVVGAITFLAFLCLFSSHASGQTAGQVVIGINGIDQTDGNGNSDAGIIDLFVNGGDCQILYQPGYVDVNIALDMVNLISNFNCSPLVTAVRGGIVVGPDVTAYAQCVVLTEKTTGSATNYPISVTVTSDFPGNYPTSFFVQPFSPTLTGGSDAPSGFVSPKYVVVAVTYAPPGSQSNVNYANSTMLGTATSVSSSFQNSDTFSVTVGGGLFTTNNLFGIGPDGKITNTVSSSFTEEEDSNSSVTINTTTTHGTTVKGPLSDAAGLNHDADVIWVWLNPVMSFTTPTPQNLNFTGFLFDTRDPVGEMDVFPIQVQYLNGHSTIPQNIRDVLNRTWAPLLDDGSSPALNNADFAQILKADPLADPAYVVNVPAGNNCTADARFCRTANQNLTYSPPPPGLPPVTQTFSAAYEKTTADGQGGSDTRTLGFSTDIAASGGFLADFTADIKFAHTFTWVNKWSSTTTNKAGQTASLSITGPAAAANYTGPTEFDVYQDTVYGTFMFAPVNQAPDFLLGATSSSQSTPVGGSATYSIGTTALRGFTDTVSLTVSSGLPAGASVNFVPASISGSGSSTLTVTTSSSTPVGSYTLTVKGTTPSLTHTTTITLVVQDFSLSPTPSSQTVVAPGSTNYTVSTSALSGFSGNIALSTATLPTGVSAVFAPTSVAVGASSTLTLSVTAATTAGNYPITIFATSGGITHSTQVNLTVTAPDFSIAATPSTQTVTAGGNTTYTVSTSALNGFTGSVSLGTSGLPTGATASFSPASISGSTTSTLTISTLSSTPAATYTITITGISGSINHNTAVLLTVNAPTGSVTISAPANNSNQSTSVRVTASATETGTTIAQMQVWDNTTGVRLGINNGSTIDQTYTLAPGTHQIIVEDLAAGTFAVIHTSSVTITVFADGVHITAPANNASITGPVHVTGFATEAATQIAQMQVWDNTTGVRLGINNGSTIDQTYTLASGTHQIIMEDLAAGTFAVIHTASVTVTVH
jgi:hypothetical protein